MEGLNKCPFCGGVAEIIGRKKMKAVCRDCGASSPTFSFRSEAVEYWNKRTIVRCKDCKFYHVEEKWCDKNSHFEGGAARTFEEGQFCSLGEKI